MSLINDALKRANQAVKAQPAEANLGSPMTPAQQSGSTKHSIVPLVVVVFLVVPAVVLLVGASGWFFWRWQHQRHPPRRAAVAASQALQHGPAGATVKQGPGAVSKAAAPLSARATAPKTTTSSNAPAAGKSVAAAATAAPRPVSSNAAPARSAPAPTAAVAIPDYGPAAAAPPPLPPVTFPKLELRGIFFSRKHPYALINGQPVGEGDRINQVRIVKIRPDTVLVELKGRTKELVFGE